MVLWAQRHRPYKRDCIFYETPTRGVWLPTRTPLWSPNGVSATVDIREDSVWRQGVLLHCQRSHSCGRRGGHERLGHVCERDEWALCCSAGCFRECEEGCGVAEGSHSLSWWRSSWWTPRWTADSSGNLNDSLRVSISPSLLPFHCAWECNIFFLSLCRVLRCWEGVPGSNVPRHIRQQIELQTGVLPPLVSSACPLRVPRRSRIWLHACQLCRPYQLPRREGVFVRALQCVHCRGGDLAGQSHMDESAWGGFEGCSGQYSPLRGPSFGPVALTSLRFGNFSLTYYRNYHPCWLFEIGRRYEGRWSLGAKLLFSPYFPLHCSV